jgi:protein SCO1/2
MHGMMHNARALFLAVMLLPAAAQGDAAGSSAAFKCGTFDPPRLAPDFALQASNGSAVTLSQYRGKVVAIAFGFTHCTKVCPFTLANLARVSRELGAAAADLQVVFVTVDPERDSRERLKDYVSAFNPAFVGATGSQEQLQAVRQSYGVTVQRENANDGPNYDVHHSSSIYLVDRDGKLRVLVPFGKTPEDILHDVRLLL